MPSATPDVSEGDVHGWASYQYLWRVPSMPALLTGFTLARLPTGMVALTLTLATLQSNESLSVAGAVTASYAIAMALTMPLIGRLVDRRGARSVLTVTGAAYPTALLLFTAVVTGLVPAGTWALVATAALAGASLPPVAPVVRSVWAQDLDETAARAANAVESLLIQCFYIAGPAAVGLLATWHVAWTAPVASAALNAAGVLLVATHRRAHALPRAVEQLHRLEALKQPGIGIVLILSLTYTAGSASLDFSVIAWAEARGSTGLSGVVLALSCIGAVLAALAYGAGHRWLTSMSLPVCFGLWAATLAVLGAATALDANFAVVTAAAVLVEAASTPMLPLLVDLIRDFAAPQLRTETFSWRLSAQMVGISAGAAVCGTAAAHLGVIGPSAVGVGVALVGTAFALRKPPPRPEARAGAGPEGRRAGHPAVRRAAPPASRPAAGPSGPAPDPAPEPALEREPGSPVTSATT